MTKANPVSQGLTDAARLTAEDFDELDCEHRTKGWVYVLAGNGVVKIGSVRASDSFKMFGPVSALLSRMRSIQSMSPVPLALIRLYTGGPEYERELHRRFVKYQAHGEWFDETVLGELDFTGCPQCGLVVVPRELAAAMHADLRRPRGEP